MNPFGTLLEAINDYRLNHGHFPRVRISKAFWDAHADEVAKLAGDGISIEVVEHLIINSSFLLEEPPDKGWSIRNAHDMKRLAEQLIAEGKGDWPVLHKPDDGEVYVPMRLYGIVPGQAPHEGLELQKDFPGAPEAEHILIQPDS